MRDWKRELVDKEGYFINIWVVEIDLVEEYVVVNIVKKYGFFIIGQVSVNNNIVFEDREVISYW